MADKRILPNLVRYLREMKNDATSHDRLILLLSGGILVGCGVGTFRNPAAALGWPTVLIVLVGLVVGAGIWLMNFTLGVLRRAPAWRPAFPPYQLVVAATVPVFVVAMVIGCGIGTVLFQLPVLKAGIASLLGHIAIVVTMHLLFKAHAPLTRQAVQTTHNPNIMTVDSHRYMWLFPALGVLGLFLVGMWAAPESMESLRHVAVTAAIVTAAFLAGFGAGYIP